MNFGTPQALWFFLIIPYFVFLHTRSFSDMARTRSAISLALRILLLSAIILALADMRLTRYSDKLSVFFLIDKSRSMGEGSDEAITDYVQSACENLDKKTDVAGMIAFGKDAYVEAGLSDQPEIGEFKSTLQPDYSDIEGAVNLAMASFPTDTGTKIVLLSDGNENIGDALTASRIAANRGTEIDSVTFGKPTKGEVSAGRLILPKKIEEGESFDVRAVIESDTETDAVIEVFENDKRIGSQQVHLVPGKNVFTFPRKKSEGGFYAYRVLVTALGDTEGENNESTDYTIVEGKPKICFVSGDKKERPYLVNALKSEGIQADFRDIGTMPTGMVKMAPYDVIFFSDVGAENLMPETMKAYDAYVKAMGGGFAMLGCENSFGPGGYFKTPIEDMLPVTLEVTKKSYLPSVAIALVVDRSGSMGMIERGVEKIEIAKAACARSVEVLEQGDWIGVVGFDFEAQWVVPMTTIENKDEIISQIGKLRAGGGTSVYAGMFAAFKSLITADAKLKHMIILSDGVTAPGDFDKLVNDMNSYGITLTTISIGSDANLQLMNDLAKNGGGNYYYCNSIHQVPQIFGNTIEYHDPDCTGSQIEVKAAQAEFIRCQ
ncbi:MAG: VWA domain-containing protein, partial [bacterium]